MSVPKRVSEEVAAPDKEKGLTLTEKDELGGKVGYLCWVFSRFVSIYSDYIPLVHASLFRFKTIRFEDCTTVHTIVAQMQYVLESRVTALWMIHSTCQMSHSTPCWSQKVSTNAVYSSQSLGTERAKGDFHSKSTWPVWKTPILSGQLAAKEVALQCCRMNRIRVMMHRDN